MTSPPPTLRRQFSWTLPANVIYGFCSFLLLMTLNKWAATDAEGTAAAGRFNWAMAATAPLFMFANLRFRTILATDTRSQNKLTDYFGIRAILLGIVSCIVGIMVVKLFRDGETTKAMLVLAIAATKVVEAFSDLCCGLQQRVERMDRVAGSLAANGLLMTTAFVAVYLSTQDVVWATLGLLAARTLVLVAYDIPLARIAARDACFSVSSLTATNSSRIQTLVFAALPLGITAGLLSLTSNIPKFIIPRIFDLGMLGIYASLAVTIQAGNLIFRAIELPAMPRLAKLIHERDATRFWQLLNKLIAVFIVLGAIGASLSLLVGGAVLGLLFNSAYETMGGVLALVVVGTAIAQVAGIIESSLIAARLTAVQLPMHCVTVGLCLVLSLALIPRFEIYGAVLAVTICRFPFMAIGVWLLRQKLAQPGDVTSSIERQNETTSTRQAA